MRSRPTRLALAAVAALAVAGLGAPALISPAAAGAGHAGVEGGEADLRRLRGLGLFTRLIGVYPFPVTDHRLVWLDLGTGAHGR